MSITTDWLVAETSMGRPRYLNCAAGRKGDPWPTDRTMATRFVSEQVARDVAADKQRQTPYMRFAAVPAVSENDVG